MATVNDVNNQLPPYPQMIIDAVDALNEKRGSNKTSISKYIESKYYNLPTSHSTLLKHHLNSMKDTGELIFWKNNYMKPDPNFIRRGRGRPPKSKGPGKSTSRPVRPKGRPQKDEYDAGDNPIQVPAAAAEPVKKPEVSPSENFGGGIGIELNTKTGRPPKDKPQL